MKILVICQYYYPEPFRVTDICESLVKNGHEVTVITGLPNYPEGQVLTEYTSGKRRNEVINGVNVIRSFEIGRGKSSVKLFLNYISFMLSGTFKALFLNGQYDVVLVNQLSPVLMAIPGIIYKKKHKKKLFLYCLDLWPESLVAGGIRKGSVVYNLFKKISRYIYKSADDIMVSSYSFIEYFKDTLNIDGDSIKYLPQYAEDLFLNINRAKKQNDNVNFVFAGNIGEMQSVETIIKAANILKANSIIKFHIIGDGSSLEQCKSLANNLQLNNVIFHGRKPLEEMPKFYEMADAMLVTLKDDPIISYTLPGKVPTYMAAEKPIIGAINGETKFVIEDSKCGLCCPAEDYINLAELITDFCNMEEKQIFSDNAKEYYSKYFSKEKYIHNLEEILNK